MGWIGDKITNMIQDWCTDTLKSFLGSIYDIVFDMPTSHFADITYTFMIGIATTLAISIVGYKLIEYMINTSTGTYDGPPLGEIMARILKSAVLIPLMPIFLMILTKYIALPICQWMIANGSKVSDKGAEKIVKAILSGIGAVGFEGFTLVIFLAVFAIAFVCFWFSICVFFADFLLLQVLSPWAAISIIADDNNYFSIWWREVLSQITSLIVKLFLFMVTLQIYIGESKVTLPLFLLSIGCLTLIIKTPSLLRNMWYSGGGGRAAMGMISGGGRIAARKFLFKGAA